MSRTNGLMSEGEYEAIIEHINSKSNPKLGILLGIILGIIAAFIWCAVAKVTNYNIGFMAIAVGYLVSVGFVKAGANTNQIYGIIAGVIALFSIFLGEIFTTIIFLAEYMEMGILEAINNIYLSKLPALVIESMDFKNIIFYVIAIRTAYSRSFINESKLDQYVEDNGMPVQST